LSNTAATPFSIKREWCVSLPEGEGMSQIASGWRLHAVVGFVAALLAGLLYVFSFTSIF
jgi:hypothetical protein